LAIRHSSVFRHVRVHSSRRCLHDQSARRVLRPRLSLSKSAARPRRLTPVHPAVAVSWPSVAAVRPGPAQDVTNVPERERERSPRLPVPASRLPRWSQCSGAPGLVASHVRVNRSRLPCSSGALPLPCLRPAGAATVTRSAAGARSAPADAASHAAHDPLLNLPKPWRAIQGDRAAPAGPRTSTPAAS